MNRIRRGPGAYRRQRQARKQVERLFLYFAIDRTPEPRTPVITYRKRRTVKEPA